MDGRYRHRSLQKIRYQGAHLCTSLVLVCVGLQVSCDGCGGTRSQGGARHVSALIVALLPPRSVFAWLCKGTTLSGALMLTIEFQHDVIEMQRSRRLASNRNAITA